MRRHRASYPLVVAVVAVLVWSWCASGVRTFTRPAEVFTFVPVLVVLVLTLRPLKRARRRKGSEVPAGRARYDPRGVALWAGALLAVVGWEMFQLVSEPRERHPTISSLLNSLISTHPSRFAGYLLWLAAGWLLLRDVVARRE